jgi:hypothetical protein
MNLVLDSLTSRRSVRAAATGGGLLAAGGFLLAQEGGAAWPQILGAALLLGACELLFFAFDGRGRRLRELAPRAFPFKNLLPEERQFLQDSLLKLPRRETLKTFLAWGLLKSAAWIEAKGFPGLDCSGALLLGISVACIACYFGLSVMGRRVAPFYYFEGDYPEALAKSMPSLESRLWMLSLPALMFFLMLLLFAFNGARLGAFSLAWIAFWGLLLSWGELRTIDDLVIAPLKDLEMALRRFGDGDYSGLLDVSSGDLVGLLSNRFNKTMRKTDMRFFVKERFGSMLPEAKNEALLEGGLKLDGEERELAVLACRVEGEKLSLSVFNKFCQAVLEVAEPQGAALDEISPGQIVCLLNAPLPLDNVESVGLELAEALKRRLEVFCSQQRMQNGLELRSRVGFAFGKSALGLLGPKGRQRYSALDGAAQLARTRAREKD